MEFFEERRRKLVDAGIIPVLVQLCKHKSENCREQVARYATSTKFYRSPIKILLVESFLDFVKMKNIEGRLLLLAERRYIASSFFSKS